MNLVDEAATVHRELAAVATTQRAFSERAYLKSSLDHLGTSVPDIRAVAKRWLKAHAAVTHDELFGLCDELWSQPVHERRMAAVELLVARPALIGAGDLAWLDSTLRDCRTWALVDTLAGTVVARIAAADDEALWVLDRWVGDRDFWIRRSAVLGLRECLRAGEQLDRFLGYADRLIDEREFFIRKVLGWTAREESCRHPDEISDWLRRNMGRMNGVTIAEAAKYLPDRAELMALYRGH